MSDDDDSIIEYYTEIHDADDLWSKEKYETLKCALNIWEWDFFGDKTINFALPRKVSAWKRFWTKIFFGSKWKRIN